MKKPFYRRWWVIAIGIFLLVGVIATITESDESKAERLATQEAKEEVNRLNKAMRTVSTVTPKKFDSLKKGMSFEEVIKTVGGKPAEERSISGNIMEYKYEGESGVSSDSKVDLLFVDEKLDTIMESGLITKTEELTTGTSEKQEPVIEKRDKEIEELAKKIIAGDLEQYKVKANAVEVNLNYSLDDGSLIVLPKLVWDRKNTAKTTKEQLETYSDHLATKLAEQSDISEITVFWEVPYHLEGDSVAKFMYERSGKGMAKTDRWFAPMLNK